MKLCVLLFSVLLLAAGCAEAPMPVDNTPVVRTNDFTMNDQFGKPVSLSDFRGKVVLLDFWATWCPPCREAMPEVKKTWEKYRDRDFMIIGVSLDFDRDLDEWRDYISTNDLGWTHIADGRYWNNAVARQYDVTAIPEMKLLDREGNIIATSHSIRRLDSLILKELEK